MVNPGGESTMLGHWRIVLRQAEEAARVGRFEEAFALATRPDVADHHHAVQFRSRLALDLIARATRRGAVDDLGGADRGPRPGRADGRPARLAGRGPAQPGRPGRRGGPGRPGRRRPGPGAGADRGPGPAQGQRPGPAADPRDRRGLAGRRWPRAVAASSAGRRSSSTGPSGWPAASGRSAPSRRSPRPRPSWSRGRRRPPPRSRRCTRPSPRGSGRRS